MLEVVITFLLAMTPLGELRLAIPVGIGVYGLGEVLVYFIAVVGNLVPVVFLLLFLEPVSKWLSNKSSIFKRFFSWLFERTRKKYNSNIKKFGYGALAFFVAIPLPITGAWTGSLIAFLFGIPFKKAFLSITSGVMTAGIIVLFLTKAGIAVEKYYGPQVLTGLLITIAFCWLMFKIFSGKNKKTTNFI